MLVGKNKYAFLQLVNLVKGDKRPLLFWIGAGASAWCEYPLWDELAALFHSKFLREEPNYDKNYAFELIKSRRFPDFFQICKKTNKERYSSALVQCFSPKVLTPVYSRFIEDLKAITPLHIVTTNVDESLERNLSTITTIQRSDLELCLDLFYKRESFICKLHGSISSLKTTIFTSDEYSDLASDEKYLSLLKSLFSQATIVFIGCGLGDEYIMELLSSNATLKDIFGDGPHFAVLPEHKDGLPKNIETIQYLLEPFKDHRSALQVIEEIKITKNSDKDKNLAAYDTLQQNSFKSAHLISDIFPPGSHNTSTTLQAVSQNGKSVTVILGNGFRDSEFPLTRSTAMHDLIVGLICFDVIYSPLSALSRVHDLLGSALFWELIKSDCLKFINWKSHLGVLYRDPTSITGGALESLNVFNNDLSEQTVQDLIRMQVQPISGKEDVAMQLFELLESKTEIIDNSKEPNITDLTRRLLYRPSMRRLLGMSEGTSLESLPRWMMFPVLRMANVVKIGAACHLLGIASTKLEFGSNELASPAFSASSGMSTADEVASYVLLGRFNADIGAHIIKTPELIRGILNFRNSQTGILLRTEILNQLTLSQGSDLVVSINAGLKSSIPNRLLQDAHDHLSGLLAVESVNSKVVPAVWNNNTYSNNALLLWRKQSIKELKEYCEKNRIGPYDWCPCGSGDKLKFCCYEALRHSE